MPNVDQNEVQKFNAIAEQWWDTDGECRPLHDLNPCRVAYIRSQLDTSGKQILDIGCGGGILSESLARSGARITGIDAASALIDVATNHAAQAGLKIAYHCTTAETYAEDHRGQFDCITCMELIEHVPDPLSLLAACSRLLNENGVAFFSTLNRTPKAYGMAILGAEYLLKLLPRGTHDYQQFVRPSEFARWLRHHGLALTDLRGMRYNPLSRRASLCDSVAVNYMLMAQKSVVVASAV